MVENIRISRMFNEWQKVQKAREKLKELNSKLQYHKKQVRSLSQDIPKRHKEVEKMLDNYDKMV